MLAGHGQIRTENDLRQKSKPVQNARACSSTRKNKLFSTSDDNIEPKITTGRCQFLEILLNDSELNCETGDNNTKTPKVCRKGNARACTSTASPGIIFGKLRFSCPPAYKNGFSKPTSTNARKHKRKPKWDSHQTSKKKRSQHNEAQILGCPFQKVQEKVKNVHIRQNNVLKTFSQSNDIIRTTESENSSCRSACQKSQIKWDGDHQKLQNTDIHNGSSNLIKHEYAGPVNSTVTTTMLLFEPFYETNTLQNGQYEECRIKPSLISKHSQQGDFNFQYNIFSVELEKEPVIIKNSNLTANDQLFSFLKVLSKTKSSLFKSKKSKKRKENSSHGDIGTRELSTTRKNSMTSVRIQQKHSDTTSESTYTHSDSETKNFSEDSGHLEAFFPDTEDTCASVDSVDEVKVTSEEEWDARACTSGSLAESGQILIPPNSRDTKARQANATECEGIEDSLDSVCDNSRTLEVLNTFTGSFLKLSDSQNSLQSDHDKSTACAASLTVSMSNGATNSLESAAPDTQASDSSFALHACTHGTVKTSSSFGWELASTAFRNQNAKVPHRKSSKTAKTRGSVLMPNDPSHEKRLMQQPHKLLGQRKRQAIREKKEAEIDELASKIQNLFQDASIATDKVSSEIKESASRNLTNSALQLIDGDKATTMSRDDDCESAWTLKQDSAHLSNYFTRDAITHVNQQCSDVELYDESDTDSEDEELDSQGKVRKKCYSTISDDDTNTNLLCPYDNSLVDTPADKDELSHHSTCSSRSFNTCSSASSRDGESNASESSEHVEQDEDVSQCSSEEGNNSQSLLSQTIKEVHRRLEDNPSVDEYTETSKNVLSMLEKAQRNNARLNTELDSSKADIYMINSEKTTCIVNAKRNEMSMQTETTNEFNTDAKSDDGLLEAVKQMIMASRSIEDVVEVTKLISKRSTKSQTKIDSTHEDRQVQNECSIMQKYNASQDVMERTIHESPVCQITLDSISEIHPSETVQIGLGRRKEMCMPSPSEFDNTTIEALEIQELKKKIHDYKATQEAILYVQQSHDKHRRRSAHVSLLEPITETEDEQQWFDDDSTIAFDENEDDDNDEEEGSNSDDTGANFPDFDGHSIASADSNWLIPSNISGTDTMANVDDLTSHHTNSSRSKLTSMWLSETSRDCAVSSITTEQESSTRNNTALDKKNKSFLQTLMDDLSHDSESEESITEENDHDITEELTKVTEDLRRELSKDSVSFSEDEDECSFDLNDESDALIIPETLDGFTNKPIAVRPIPKPRFPA